MLGSVTYAYNNKYSVSFNIRSDINSRNLADSVEVEANILRMQDFEIVKPGKWNASYGVRAAWQLSEEQFFKGSAAVTNLSLHVAYGLANNDGGYFPGRIYPYYWAPNPAFNGFNPDEDFVSSLFSEGGSNVRNLWYSEPEKTSEIEVGVNLSLYNKVFLNGNYFSRNTTNILMPDMSDSLSYKNFGELGTSGVELGFQTLNVTTKAFSWITMLNFTKYMQSVETVGDSYGQYQIGYNGNSNIIKEGEPLYAFWGYETEGLFQNEGEVASHATQQGAAPGDIRYKNLDGNNVIDENDKTIIGDPNPDYMVGFNNIFKVSNFELSVLFYAVMGQDILNLTRMQTEGLNSYYNQSETALERWSGEGTSTTIPRASTRNMNNTLVSDRFIEDGSYIQLKNVTLAYYVPRKWIRNADLGQFKVFLTAQNILYITDYTGYDPQISSMGPLNIDYGAYPNPRYFWRWPFHLFFNSQSAITKETNYDGSN
ncbi:MAG: hypothetical protein HC896_02695, partial [Bacteroidales bacterium]|nr:hypothetical protein [Bacteroidales bacterium]